MVAEEHYLVGAVVQADVPRRVPRRLYHLQAVAAIGEDVPVSYIGVVGHLDLLVLHGRAVVEVGQLLLREAEAAVFGGALPALGHAAYQAPSVLTAYVEARALAGEVDGQAGVVGVHVREEDVRDGHIHVQLGQALGQSLTAGLKSEARVYQQVAVLALDYVGVQAAQGIVRQRHGYSIDVVFDVGVHFFSPFRLFLIRQF